MYIGCFVYGLDEIVISDLYLIGKLNYAFTYLISTLVKLYSLRPKLYDVLGILHILRNVINIVWKKDIMSCFTKLSLINNMGKINERIKRRESNK